jgi:transposase
MQPYSLDLRERVIAALQAGKLTQPQIAEKYEISLRTVETWARQWRETGTIKAKPHLSGPARTLQVHDELIRQAIAAQPDLTLAELCLRVTSKTQGPASASMMCRELQHLKLPRKKIAPRQSARNTARPKNAANLSRANDGEPAEYRRPPKIHR